MTKLNNAEKKELLKSKEKSSNQKSLKEKVSWWLEKTFSGPEKKTWNEKEMSEFFWSDFSDKLIQHLKSHIKSGVITNRWHDLIDFNTAKLQKIIDKKENTNLDEDIKNFIKDSFSNGNMTHGSDNGRDYDFVENDSDDKSKSNTAFISASWEEVSEDEYTKAIYTYIIDTIWEMAGSDIPSEDHKYEAISIFRDAVNKNYEKSQNLSKSQNRLKALIISIQQTKRNNLKGARTQ